jgi:hypothetical protein
MVPPPFAHQKGTIVSQPIMSVSDSWVQSEDMRELKLVIGNAQGFRTFEKKAFPEQLKVPKDKYTPEQAQAWHEELDAFERLKRAVALRRLKRK